MSVKLFLVTDSQTASASSDRNFVLLVEKTKFAATLHVKCSTVFRRRSGDVDFDTNRLLVARAAAMPTTLYQKLIGIGNLSLATAAQNPILHVEHSKLRRH